jgi:NADH-quinone oxidoreductase subunit B
MRFAVINPVSSCCAEQADLAFAPQQDCAAEGFYEAPSPEQADVLVLAGPLSKKAAAQLREIYAAMPEPKYVLAFGACAASGGAFYDSYAVAKGAHLTVPVDLTVYGCPPEPKDFIAALRELRKLAREAKP